MDFKTSYDAQTRDMTWAGCGIFGVFALQRLYTYSLSPRERMDILAMALETFLFLTIPLVVYLFSPLGYSVRDGALVIHRPLRPVVIPLEEIQNVELLASDDITASYRVFGVGGLFGYYGLFFRNELGIVHFYLRNKENPIMIDTANHGRLLISPDSPGLLRALIVEEAP
jgi:hypothetical protein